MYGWLCTLGRTTMKSVRRVLGHSLLRSLGPLAPHRSRAPLRSFVRSLAHSLSMKLMRRFHTIATASAVGVDSSIFTVSLPYHSAVEVVLK